MAKKQQKRRPLVVHFDQLECPCGGFLRGLIAIAEMRRWLKKHASCSGKLKASPDFPENRAVERGKDGKMTLYRFPDGSSGG
ncbi:MAG: hypothetical protein Q8K86_08805 [Candidatus Nanopelagicaceae bacterium]|nr:hypothetical protein [Candidatus Nanopelagicaceae bacterium]